MMDDAEFKRLSETCQKLNRRAYWAGVVALVLAIASLVLAVARAVMS